ncbi:unnamed protein product [Trichogramma brassicae]|uniref:Uncharacterized protein n=1 Tax=Trichogramma brassicae TaxID=86971 RepID=A0A6H5IW73_9HYME|nr:unnamed protein product [Trichogramma brassicae]
MLERITIMHININSLRDHFTQVRNAITTNDIDVLSLAETWMTPGLPTKMCSIPGYKLIKNDRGLRATVTKRKRKHDRKRKNKYMQGGGVACYVRDTIPHRVLHAPQITTINETESLLLELGRGRRKLLVGAVYRRPGGFYLSEFFDAYYSLCHRPYDGVIIAGDFNVDLLSDDYETVHFRRLVMEASLEFVPFGATHHGATFDTAIDSIIVDALDRVTRSVKSLTPYTAAHDSLMIEYRLVDPLPIGDIGFYRDKRGIAVPEFELSLRSALDCVRDLEDVDDMVNGMHGIMLDSLSTFAPLRRRSMRTARAPWFTPALRERCKMRDGLYQRYKRTRDPDLLRRFRQLRQELKRESRTAREAYLLNGLRSCSTEEGRWSYLRRMGISAPQLPSPLTFFAPEELLDHYCAVTTVHQGCSADVLSGIIAMDAQDDLPVFNFRNVTEVEVLSALARVSRVALVLVPAMDYHNLQIYLQCPPSEINSTIAKLNEEAQSVANWAHDNGLMLNISKTKAILFAFDQNLMRIPWDLCSRIVLEGTEIRFEDCVKNLGLSMYRSLSWRNHVSVISSRVHGCHTRLTFRHPGSSVNPSAASFNIIDEDLLQVPQSCALDYATALSARVCCKSSFLNDLDIMTTLPQATTISINSFIFSSPNFSAPHTTFCSSSTAVTSSITTARASTMIFSSQSAGVGSSRQIRPEPQLDPRFAALSQDAKLDKLYEAISFVAAQNRDLQSTMNNITTMIGEHETRLNDLENNLSRAYVEIEKSRTHIDQMSYCSRQQTTEFTVSGIPSSLPESENDQVVGTVLTCIGAQRFLSDITRVRRLKPKDASSEFRTLLVVCKSSVVRDEIIRLKILKGDIPVANILPAYRDAAQRKLYLNEWLLQDTFKLLQEVRAKARTCGFERVWIRGGIIYVRKNGSSQKIQINSNLDLRR